MDAADPSLLRLSGIAARTALEQQLFFALRDGRIGGAHLGRWRAAGHGALIGLAATGASIAARPAKRRPGQVAVLTRVDARDRILAPIAAEVERLVGPHQITRLRVGRTGFRPRTDPDADRLQDFLAPGLGLRALRDDLRLVQRLGAATSAWEQLAPRGLAAGLRLVAARELVRIELGAMTLARYVRLRRPPLLAAFDEVGTWSRIMPEVARDAGIPSLNLPHSEAADPSRLAGIAYDRYAVFGSRAADVLEAVGVARDQITITGAPHFDNLVAGSDVRPVHPPRVVFAAQYVQGAMSRSVLAACYRAALAAATAVGPSELLILPHPLQQAGLAEGLIDRDRGPGVRQRLGAAGTLHESLHGAFAMVTGWSNSVFEAALLGVPTLLVQPGGLNPVSFADDGLGIAVADEPAAAAAATSLAEGRFRASVVARARDALPAHIGPLDGHAARRTAELIINLSNVRSGAGAAARSDSASRPGR